MNPFPESAYAALSNDQLIAYAILSVKRQLDDCTFERLVKECYTLFPKNFSFYRYPEWPDSLKLDRPLRELRQKRLISGSNQTKFDLTSIGERYALEVEKKLSGSTTAPEKVKVVLGRKEKRIFDALKASEAYAQFTAHEELALAPADLKQLFFGTMETPLAVIQKNIDHIRELAMDAKETELVQFLDYCRKASDGSR